MASVNPPRGMRDFLPAEKARRERVLAVIRERYRAHGFDEIETPVMEEYSRLHAGIGGDNEKLAYNVLKRGLDADAIRAAADDPAALTDLGLRYDLTVPLARFYASHRGELPTRVPRDPERAGLARRAPAEGPLPPVHAVRHRHHRRCLVPRRGRARRRDARHRRRAGTR